MSEQKYCNADIIDEVKALKYVKINKSRVKTKIINGHEYLYYRWMVNGRDKTIYAKTLRDLEKKYNAYLNSTDDTTGNKSFNNYFDLYLKSKKKSWKVQTYNSRLNFYENHVKTSFLAKKKFSKITTTDINKFIEKLNLSNSTKREKLQVIKQFFNWCIENNYCINNPCNGIEVKIKNNEYPEVISASLVNKILNDIHGEEIEPVIILLSFGCRLGEAMASNINNLDDSGIIIDKSLTKTTVNGKTRTFLEPPKTKDSIRKIYLPKEVIDILRNCTTSIDGYYCKTRRGWMSRNRIYRFLNKYNVSPHQLRKFYATTLLRGGVNVYTVKEVLGHSKSSLYTEKYYLLKDSNRTKQELQNFYTS